MERKIIKPILARMLIITLTMADIILLGYNAVSALSTTNVEKVEFDANFNAETAKIQEGATLNIQLAVTSGLLKDGKIKIENANFKIKEVESKYIKNVNTIENEIEINQLIAGNKVEFQVPVVFDSAQTITKDYLSKTAEIKLTGNYKDGESTTKVEANRELHINWIEEEQIAISQGIDKWVNITENKTLVEQSINVSIENNVLVKEKQLEINIPEIQNTLPEKIDLLVNGNKANEENYSYNKENKTVTIKMPTREEETYKLIYYYPQNLPAENLKLNTNLKVLLYTEETLEQQDEKEIEVQAIGCAVSANSQSTTEMYKGYLYANLENATNYEENMQIEITSLEQINNIRIDGISSNFLDEKGNKHNVTGSTYIRKVKLNKSNLQAILGENFEVKLGEEIVNKDSNWDEKGQIEISLEEKDLATMVINISKPEQIGTIKINMEKYVKGTTGYTKAELKTFTKLENQSTLSIGDARIVATSTSELKDTTTEAKLELSTTKFSSAKTNDNVQITATLKSNSNKYDLFKNPYIEIKLPDELQEIKVHSINKVYGDEFEFTKAIYVPESKTIVLRTKRRANKL